MPLIVVGLSHQNTPVEVRERLAFTTPGALERGLDFLQSKIAGECVLLSTCNRTELYASGDTDGATLAAWLLEARGEEGEMARKYLTERQGHKAIEHLFRVSSGLESLILGENDIVRQVRDAYQTANTRGATGSVLNPLFHEALRVGKRARTEMNLSSGAFSVGHAAADLAATIFGDLRGRTVMILGAGKMSESTARHLTSSGATSVLVANRTYDRAVLLAEALGGRAIMYEDFATHLAKADIVIASTSSPVPIVTRETVRNAMQARRDRPLFLIDIAVPRDIEASVGDLDDVFLYNIDDLTAVIESEAAERRLRAVQAEKIILEESRQMATRLRTTQTATPLVMALRDKHHQLVESELGRLRTRLSHLSETDWAQIEAAFTSLENKIAHEPTVRIKQYAEAEDPAKLETARELFGVVNTSGEKTQ
jgi:glutamyl-tRNA reductase